MKRYLALLLVLVMLFALTACSQKAATDNGANTEQTTEQTTEESSETTTDTQEEHEPVTLTVWFYADPGKEEFYQKWFEAVHEEYPWITMEYEVLPYESGPEKVTVAYATNTTPDILLDGYSRIAPAVNAGITADVTDVIEEYSDVFLAEQLDGKMADGNYGFIAMTNGAPYGILVNMDLAEQLGVADLLPEDKTLWTYDELLEICRAAEKANPDVIPMGLFAGSQSSDAWYYSWFLANGLDLCNEDLTATAFNNDENREKSLQILDLFKTMIDEGLTADGCATLVDQDIQSLWGTGNVLMLAGAWNNMSTYYVQQQEGTCAEFNYDIYCIPTAEGKEAPDVACWGSSGVAVFKNNGNEEAAKLAIGLYLADPAYQTEYCSLFGAIPVTAGTNITYEADWITEAMEFGTAYGAEHAVSDFGIIEPWWTEFRGTFYPQLQDFYVGNIDAQTLLDNWQTSGDAVIRAANEAE